MIQWSSLESVIVSVFGWVLVGYLGVGVSPANAQNLRDPTVPPAELGVLSAEASPNSTLFDTGITAIVIRDGKTYVAIGTRLYASGQQLGSARIERISETEIWLRENGVLHKVPHFPGVVRRSAQGCSDREVGGPQNGHTKGSPAASKSIDSSKPQNLRVPCIGVQSRGPTQ